MQEPCLQRELQQVRRWGRRNACPSFFKEESLIRLYQLRAVPIAFGAAFLCACCNAFVALSAMAFSAFAGGVRRRVRAGF